MAVPEGFRLPTVHLNNIHLEVHEDEDGTKALVMGPVALVLPLDDAGIEWLTEELKRGASKVQVVPASVLSSLPKTLPGS